MRTTDARPRSLPWPIRVAVALLAWPWRARGWRRLARLAPFGLALLVAQSFAWWSLSLWGYPDVGDPFDAAAYQVNRVPDEENAFVLYRQAAARLVPWNDDRPPGEFWSDVRRGWSEGGPAPRAWLARNREALDLWRLGTERPRAFDPSSPTLFVANPWPLVDRLNREFTWLALLEAERLRARGDLAGAWGWYRAVIRSGRHITMHSGGVRRGLGDAIYERACRAARRWADDPRMDDVLIRRALDDLAEIDAMTPPLSEAIRTDYLMLMKTLDDWPPATLGIRPWENWYEHLPGIKDNLDLLYRARIALRRDRERSRRVIRMVYANWLARGDRSPVLVVRPGFGLSIPIYEPAPTAPAAARALSPRALADRVGATVIAREFLPVGGQTLAPPPAEWSRGRVELLTTLAERLYQAEHGQAPRSPEDLIGRYLRRRADGSLEPITARGRPAGRFPR